MRVRYIERSLSVGKTGKSEQAIRTHLSILAEAKGLQSSFKSTLRVAFALTSLCVSYSGNRLPQGRWRGRQARSEELLEIGRGRERQG